MVILENMRVSSLPLRANGSQLPIKYLLNEYQF